MLVTVVYLWGISAAVSGLARYMAPVYGLLGLLAGVALLEVRGVVVRRTGLRSP